MKKGYVLASAVLTLLAGTVHAGRVQSVPVEIDFVAQQAIGDQFTARTADDETSFIGCGTRNIDIGGGSVFTFGFCQAGDAEGNAITCFTENPELVAAMRANNSYTFITFSWDDDGEGNLTCRRVGFSTQSWYLPKK